MQCPHCQEQIEQGLGSCPACGQQLAIKVLSRQERDNFGGITIEDNSNSNTNSHHQYNNYDQNGRTRVRHVNINFNSSGWAGKLIAAAVLAILVFFFLPVLLFILLAVGGVLGAVWLLNTIRRL